MKNTVTEFVEKLDDSVKRQILKEYDQFEEDGFIGECELRTQARILMKELKAGDHGITTWMSSIAYECWRYYTTKYFELQDRGEA